MHGVSTEKIIRPIYLWIKFILSVATHGLRLQIARLLPRDKANTALSLVFFPVVVQLRHLAPHPLVQHQKLHCPPPLSHLAGARRSRVSSAAARPLRSPLISGDGVGVSPGPGGGGGRRGREGRRARRSGAAPRGRRRALR